MLDLFLIALAAFAVLRATRHDLAAGFPLAAALLILLPGQLRIEVPGSFPEITVHRVILGILLLRRIQAPRLGQSYQMVGYTFALGLLLASRLFSDLLSVTPGSSLKDLLNFTIETFIYFHLARFALATAAARLATVRAVALSLLLVAGVAFVERYTGVSLPLLVIGHFKYCYDGIQSTYPHRILLGYAMAMGAPLVLMLIDAARTPGRRRGWWLVLFALIGTCFFADSRGGWMGMALGIALCFVTGSGQTRRRCLGLLALALVVIVLRPGIRETILSRVTDTYASDTYKATSYQYRWRLWNVAYSEITRSPERLLFGYGGLSTETMDLSQYFPSQAGGTSGKIGYTSWDNHYASDLIEFGLVGLTLELLLYALLLVHLWRRWLAGSEEIRPLIIATLVSSVVFVFARTNVYIFGEPLKFLFWTVVALGTAAAQAETVAVPVPPPGALPRRPELLPT
jgi:O-antigen ligase